MNFEIAERINEIKHSNLCTGCGTCAGVCPEKVLKMKMTPEGRYIPEVVNTNCTKCLLCMKVCPTSNENISELNSFIFNMMPDNEFIENFINCYKGYAADSAIRWGASSGGLITSLLIFLLEERLIDGALLTRGNEDDPLKAEPFIARTRKDILSAMGSKYVPVPLNQLLSEIISQDGRLAVVGLPCHIQGIRRAELNIRELQSKIIYHFGLTCSHTLNYCGIEFILHKIGVKLSEVAKLKYRGDGWPSGIKVTLKSGEQRFLPNQGSWWSEIFGAYFFTPYNCTLCHDHLSELADISFADAWLPETMKHDKVGTSIVIARTHIGDELIKATASKNIIEIFALNTQDVIHSQLWPLLFKKRNIKARIRLLKILGKTIPKNLRDNTSTFLNPTLWDYIVAPIPYINIFISNNKLLRRVLEHIPLKLLAFYRQTFKWMLLRHANKT